MIIPKDKRDLVLDELLKTDVYRSISEKKEEILGRMSSYE